MSTVHETAVDAERRFGGLARLYGPGAPARLARAHVAVIGLGGVGSWTAEALARSGVGALTLIDLDVVSESNVNRQLHALSSTLGQSKIQAMADRIAEINPECRLTLVDDFVTPENVSQLLGSRYDALLDCADQAPAKIAMILHARQSGIPIVVCGGAGGKTDTLSLRGGDLSTAVNDALLAKLRNVLRRQHGFARASDQAGKPRKRVPKMNVFALWFDQPAILPAAWAAGSDTSLAEASLDPAPRGETSPDQASLEQGARPAPAGLSCAGYGSVVTVTAVMGMAAAHQAVRWIADQDGK